MEKAEEFREKGLSIALEYGHKDMATMIIYNQNLLILYDDVDEMIKNAYKAINIYGDSIKGATAIHALYSQIRGGYAHLGNFEKVEEIDNKFEKLYAEGEFTKGQYIYYLSHSITADLANDRMDGTLERLQYLEDYYASNLYTPSNFDLYFLYATWIDYYELTGNIKEQLKYTDLSYKNFIQIPSLEDQQVEYMRAVLMNSESAIKHNDSYKRLLKLDLTKEIRFLDSIRI